MKNILLDAALFRRSPSLVFVSLFVLGFILYGQILNAPFVYDDHTLLLDSPLIKSLSAPLEHWTVSTTKLVTMWTFAVNYQLGGENPLGYHLANVSFHVINAWLLYQLILLCFKTPALKKSFLLSQSTAFLAAAILLMHPLQTESVSFIWQRSELLNAFFYLLAMICYLKGRMERQSGYFLLTTICFGLGFYSKGMIISLPLMLVLVEDLMFSYPRDKKIFLKFSVGFLIAAMISFFNVRLIYDFRQWFFHILTIATGTILTPPYFFTQIEVLIRYLCLTFLPFPFAQNLDHDISLATNFSQPMVFLSTIILIMIWIAGIWLWKKHRLMALGIFWFFIVLLPGAFLGGRDPMVEHRLYFAVAGFAVFSSAALTALLERRKSFVWLVGIILLLLGILTMARNHLWQSPQLLFEDTVAKSPHKARPAMMLGTVYLTQNKLEQAKQMFQKAIQLDPKSAESYNNLGFIALIQSQTMEAEDLFEKAISVRTNFAAPYINLGYLTLGMGDDVRAEELFQKALRMNQDDDVVFVGLGNVYLDRREFVIAKSFFEGGLKLNPYNYKAYFSLGHLFFLQKNYAAAIAQYQRALAIKPDFSQAIEQIASCYTQMHDFATARQFLKRAQELSTQNLPPLGK